MEKGNTVLTLSWIILIATLLVLVVSLNKYGITGFSTSTDNGTVNLTITAQASLRFVTSTCDFGSGNVDEEPLFAILYSNDTEVNGTGWAGCTDGLTLRNDGDVALTVTVSSSLTAAQFIGGNQATPEIAVASSNSTGGCSGTLLTGFTDIAGSPNVCDNLGYKNESGAGNMIRLDFKLTVPEDATPSATAKSTVITALGTSI